MADIIQQQVDRYHIYVARNTHIEYQILLVEAREESPLNKEEFYHNEQIISNAVRAAQHVFHAIHTNDLSVFQTAVHRHIRKGYYRR